MTADTKTQERQITLNMTIARLLEYYPQLEGLLMAQAPAFKKLSNPILRRTVARVTTIRQAATVGGLEPEALLATLQRAAGQAGECEAAARDANADVVILTDEPAWASTLSKRTPIDADALISAGKTPFKIVLENARQLDKGELLEVSVSFAPAPMIPMLEKAGFRHALIRDADERYRLLVATAGEKGGEVRVP